MRRNDPKLSLHRDGGTRPGDTTRSPIIDPDDDAPPGPHHEGETGQVLANAFRAVEPGSPAEKALLDVVNLLAAKQAGDGRGGGGSEITRAFMTKIAAAGLALITLVQPTVEQIAERMISPSSALERKLDETIVSQAALQQQQREWQIVIIALAKWVVDCQIAQTSGRPMPDPPPIVRLLLVQDELGKTTGQ